jgi:hypothetical protein
MPPWLETRARAPTLADTGRARATSSAIINRISSFSTRPDHILHYTKQDARIYRAVDLTRETSQRFLVSK